MSLAKPIDLLGGSPVPVHLIAEQEYCELKVDIELRNPDILELMRGVPELQLQIEKIDTGKSFHEAIAAPAQVVSEDDLRAAVSSTHAFTLVESPLRGKYENLGLAGRPDALHFDGAGRAWVVEYKVRSRDYPTASDDVQLRLYAYLLLSDTMFQVNNVTLVCASTSRETSERIKRLPESERAAFVREICGAAPGASQPRKLMTDHFIEGRKSQRVSVATFAYDDAKLQNELRFLSGYWLGKRRTKPTTKPYKCAVCRVNALGMCPVPLVPFREPSHAASNGKKL